MVTRISSLAALLFLASITRAQPAGLSADERARIDADIMDLGRRIEAVRDRAERAETPTVAKLYPDAEVFRKAVVWALWYEPKF